MLVIGLLSLAQTGQWQAVHVQMDVCVQGFFSFMDVARYSKSWNRYKVLFFFVCFIRLDSQSVITSSTRTGMYRSLDGCLSHCFVLLTIQFVSLTLLTGRKVSRVS